MSRASGDAAVQGLDAFRSLGLGVGWAKKPIFQERIFSGTPDDGGWASGKESFPEQADGGLLLEGWEGCGKEVGWGQRVGPWYFRLRERAAPCGVFAFDEAGSSAEIMGQRPCGRSMRVLALLSLFYLLEGPPSIHPNARGLSCLLP